MSDGDGTTQMGEYDVLLEKAGGSVEKLLEAADGYAQHDGTAKAASECAHGAKAAAAALLSLEQARATRVKVESEQRRR